MVIVKKYVRMRYKRSKKLKQYWKEIICLLILKLVLLLSLWYVCFRHPIEVNEQAAVKHIIE